MNADVETPEKDALGIRGVVSPVSFHKGVQNSEVIQAWISSLFRFSLLLKKASGSSFVRHVHQLPHNVSSALAHR